MMWGAGACRRGCGCEKSVDEQEDGMMDEMIETRMKRGLSLKDGLCSLCASRKIVTRPRNRNPIFRVPVRSWKPVLATRINRCIDASVAPTVAIHNILAGLDKLLSLFPPRLPYVTVLLQETPQLCSLFHLPSAIDRNSGTHDDPWDFLALRDGPNVIEHLPELWLGQFLRSVERFQDVRLVLREQSGIFRFRPPVFRDEP